MTKVTLTTTFNLLRGVMACSAGYQKLAKHLGGVAKYGADTPINLLTVLESNGVNDTLWCLQATNEDCDKVARLMAADFAEAVLAVFEDANPNNNQPRLAIRETRDYVHGRITYAQLSDAARDAARMALETARDATKLIRAKAMRAERAAWVATKDASRDVAMVTKAVRAKAVARNATAQAKIIRKYLK